MWRGESGLRDIDQMKAELEALSTEKGRQAYFENLIEEFDKADALNDRKHCRKERRHEFDLTALDAVQDEAVSIPRAFMAFSNAENWEDVLFSQKPEDLYELLTDEDLINAVRGLSEKRKEVLFYRGVWRYTPQEIGRFRGVSDRNIRKLYEKAIKAIHDNLIKSIDNGQNGN